MPLNPLTLKNELIKVCDKATEGNQVSFVDMADAVEKYAMELQFPPPVGVKTGIIAMKGTLSGISHQMGSQAPMMIGNAFVLLGTAIASGMPIGGSLIFPTIPPAGPPNLSAVFSGPQDTQIFASKFSSIVDAWMRTGMYDAFGVPSAGTTPPIPGPSPWM
tara:strand:+ start:201 stop:683 length:483 start_codon:yes stop_codon:yes gene_type:complete